MRDGRLKTVSTYNNLWSFVYAAMHAGGAGGAGVP